MDRQLSKIFVDSRFRFNGPSSDFSVELLYDQEMPNDWGMWLGSCSFPASWLDVSARNQNLYVLERDGGVVTARVLQIPEGNYTLNSLAQAIQTATGYPVGEPADEPNALSITPTTMSMELRLPTWRELTDSNWKTAVWDAADTTVPYDRAAPNTINEILTAGVTSEYVSPHDTPIVDLRSDHALYLTCSLSNYGTLDAEGRRSILARIPVDVGYGFVQQYRHNGLSQDMVDVSNLRFKNLRFRLVDVHGRTVDLRGGQLSLELVFGPK